MKRSILLFILILIFAGCKDSSNSHIVNGKIVRATTGEGIPNQEVHVQVCEDYEGGFYASPKCTDYEMVTTDVNGDFIVPVKYVCDSYLTIRTWDPDDEYAGTGHSHLPIDENIDILLETDKYINFEVHVNNVSPYDDDDFVNIYANPQSRQAQRIKIENFGVQNITNQTSWNGTNVNSIVYYRVREGSDYYRLSWRKRKNGIETSNGVNEIPLTVDQLNEFHFDY